MTDVEPAVPPVPGAVEPIPPMGLAIASMVTGITGVLLSIAGFGLLPAIAAVVTGHLAQKRQPHARPFWLTGIITGYVGLGLSVIIGLWVFGTALLFLLTISGVLGRYY